MDVLFNSPNKRPPPERERCFPIEERQKVELPLSMAWYGGLESCFISSLLFSPWKTPMSLSAGELILENERVVFRVLLHIFQGRKFMTSKGSIIEPSPREKWHFYM